MHSFNFITFLVLFLHILLNLLQIEPHFDVSIFKTISYIIWRIPILNFDPTKEKWKCIEMSVGIPNFIFPQGVINDVALAQGNNTPLAFAQAPVAVGSPALVMTKSILRLPQLAYEPVIYGIVVQNVGTSIATGVIVEDHAVSHVAFIDGYPRISILALSPSTIRFFIGNMLPGQIATVYVAGRIF